MYATITSDTGQSSTDYSMVGDIPLVQIISGTDQRLGSSQPIFFQSAARARQVDIGLTKIVSGRAATLQEKNRVESMQGKKVTVINQHGESIETFCKMMNVLTRLGANNEYLFQVTMTCEAMPS